MFRLENLNWHTQPPIFLSDSADLGDWDLFFSHCNKHQELMIILIMNISLSSELCVVNILSTLVFP